MNTPDPQVQSHFSRVAAPRIKARRKLLRLTQGELATAAGVSLKLVGMIEAGKPTVQLDGLEKVLHVLGFTLTLDGDS